MSEPPSPPPQTVASRPDDDPERWRLIRDLVAFQLKLALDAARDFLLSPIALVLGLLDLAAGRHRGGYFDGLLDFGRRTDVWINLFGSHDGNHGEDREVEPVSVDLLVEQVEGLLVEQVERGGLTASAKAAIDRSLDRLGRSARATRRRPPPE